MDYKKQIKYLEEKITRCRAYWEDYNRRESDESSTPLHVAKFRVEDSLEDLGIVLAAHFEAHKNPEFTKQILDDFKNLPLEGPGEEGYATCPKLMRAESYFEAFKLIVTPSIMDRIEKELKIFGAFVAVLIGIAGLLKLNHEITTTKALIKQQQQPLIVTPGTLIAR